MQQQHQTQCRIIRFNIRPFSIRSNIMWQIQFHQIRYNVTRSSALSDQIRALYHIHPRLIRNNITRYNVSDHMICTGADSLLLHMMYQIFRSNQTRCIIFILIRHNVSDSTDQFQRHQTQCSR